MQIRKLVLLLLFIIAWEAAFAQGAYFRFGDLDTMATSGYVAHKATVTWSEVLANTRFAFVGGREFKITGCLLSFVPVGGDFRGPFTIKGNEWPDNIKQMVKEKLTEYPRTKVYLENIRVIGPDGFERALPSPITFTAEP